MSSRRLTEGIRLRLPIALTTAWRRVGDQDSATRGQDVVTAVLPIVFVIAATRTTTCPVYDDETVTPRLEGGPSLLGAR